MPSFCSSGVPEYPAIYFIYRSSELWQDAVVTAALAQTREIPFRSSGFIVRAKIDNVNSAVVLIALSIFASGCKNRSNAVSGTIEVDEVHVGPRSGGRVEKIFNQEGDQLHAGQPIVQLDAAELKARRDLAAAQGVSL